MTLNEFPNIFQTNSSLTSTSFTPRQLGNTPTFRIWHSPTNQSLNTRDPHRKITGTPRNVAPNCGLIWKRFQMRNCLWLQWCLYKNPHETRGFFLGGHKSKSVTTQGEILTQNGHPQFCVKIHPIEKHNQTYPQTKPVWSTTKFGPHDGPQARNSAPNHSCWVSSRSGIMS